MEEGCQGHLSGRRQREGACCSCRSISLRRSCCCSCTWDCCSGSSVAGRRCCQGRCICGGGSRCSCGGGKRWLLPKQRIHQSGHLVWAVAGLELTKAAGVAPPGGGRPADLLAIGVKDDAVYGSDADGLAGPGGTCHERCQMDAPACLGTPSMSGTGLASTGGCRQVLLCVLDTVTCCAEHHTLIVSQIMLLLLNGTAEAVLDAATLLVVASLGWLLPTDAAN